MMDTSAIRAIVEETTQVFRTGPEASVREHGQLRVIEVFGYPPTSERVPHLQPVDMIFVMVGVDVEASGMRERLLAAIGDGIGIESGVNLADGPSYIHLGADLGSQERALRFMALGDVIGLWKVVRPSDLGLPMEQNRELASRGLLYAIGFGQMEPVDD